MKVLIACEFSGVVREAFAKRGHDAWSCDLLPSEKTGNHIIGPVEYLLATRNEWDLLIAFPPCTHLAVSGAKYWAAKRKDGRQEAAMCFFMRLANQHQIPRIAIENPVGIMSTYWRKPDQIIHPWQFGHPESKSTCLWLKNLPPLRPTEVLPLPECGYWHNQTPKHQNKLTSGRAQDRGRTYQGIANAMAEQWNF